MTMTPSLDPVVAHAPIAADGMTRRRFNAVLLAGSTLAVGLPTVWDPAKAHAGEGVNPIPSNDTVADQYDFMDNMRDVSWNMTPFLVLRLTPDGGAYFEMPRCEVGQGIQTGCAQLIAAAMDVPYENVEVVHSKARQEFGAGQLTGGSSALYSLWWPIRTLCEAARGRLAATAAEQWGVPPDRVQTRNGNVLGPNGQLLSYAALAAPAALSDDEVVNVGLGPLKSPLVGRPMPRKDVHDIVTGAKVFALDLDIPGALPTMIRRAPQINGSVNKVHNLDAVKNLPGVTDVAVVDTLIWHHSEGEIVPSGVAVRARTFGQCIDAMRALEVDWNPGTIDGKSSDDLKAVILADPAHYALPPRPAAPALPGQTVIEDTIFGHYRNSDPLEPNCAVADVRGDSATIWAASKVPIAAQQWAAEAIGIPQQNVVFNVTFAGGSFGRKLFGDHAVEAAKCSKLFGKPVKLMWHRVNSQRHARMHPAAASTVRFTISGRSITSYTQRHVSSAMDLSHGLGDVLTSHAMATSTPGQNSWGNEGVDRYFFQTVTQVQYNFGVTDVGLDGVFGFETLPTSPVRQVYSPDVGAMRELMVDRVADHMGMDYYEFRRAFLKHDWMRAALDKAAEEGEWGKKMPAGTAQAIACHEEYKGLQVAVMEIDNRPAQLKRTYNGIPAGPRITRCTAVCDVGLPLNPDQVQAQFMGGIIDGIAFALTQGQHIEDGAALEGTYDQNLYTRQWNTPPDFKAIVMPARRDYPGGAGEIGNAAGYAAAACAYQRVIGKPVTELPINFRNKLHFFPYEKGTVPASPENLLP